jgi:hypothetical protein
MQPFFFQRGVIIRKVFVAQTVSLRPCRLNLTNSATTGNLRYNNVSLINTESKGISP